MKSKAQIMKKEQMELERWKKMKEKPVPRGYLTLMVVVIAIVYLLDSMVTDLHGGLSELEIKYFSGQLGLPYDSVLAIFSMIGMFSIVLNLIAPFYKSLADKIGRKKIFMISTAGMGVGLLFGYFSTNLVVYIIGRAILTFFMIADIQVIYIMEVAPAEKRASLFSVTKFISLLGVLIIPLSRDLLLDPSGNNWRDICIIPTLVAIGCVLLIGFFIRESDVFLDKRIALLETPYEERMKHREEMKKNHQVDTSKGGIGVAIRCVMKEKQMRMIVISYSVFLLGMNSFISYFNTVCLKEGMGTDDITKALYIYPVVSAFATLSAGFISDRIGRKKTVLLYAVIALCGMAGYILVAGVLSPFVVGAFYGFCNGCYWVVGDSMQMMLGESAKTEIRSSVTAAMGFTSLIASLISSLVYSILILRMDIMMLCLGGGILTMTVMLILLFTGTKETKGVKLEEV